MINDSTEYQTQKKILVISEVFSPEEFLINDLVFSWKEQGFLVSVLTRNPSYPKGKLFPGYRNPVFQKEIIKQVAVSRVQIIPGYNRNKLTKILNYFWNMILGMLWGVRHGNKFDAIFIYHTGPLTFSSIGIFIKRLYHKKVTIWTQDVWPDTVFAYDLAKKGLSRKILEKFVTWVYKHCDTITVSSPGFIPVINKYCPSKSIKFIPQWSLTSKYGHVVEKTQQYDFSGTFNFVFAGNISKAQNLENVLSGFARYNLQSSNTGTWLHIVGDGSHLGALHELVKNEAIPNVKFWGRKSLSEMPVFYKQADVLLISLENRSIFNLTIPAKFQSYLNAEKPLFGVLNGEVARMIETYDLGWVSDPDNIEEIARLFYTIVNSSTDELKEKTRNANSLLENMFNREQIIAEFTSLVYE